MAFSQLSSPLTQPTALQWPTGPSPSSPLGPRTMSSPLQAARARRSVGGGQSSSGFSISQVMETPFGPRYANRRRTLKLVTPQSEPNDAKRGLLRERFRERCMKAMAERRSKAVNSKRAWNGDSDPFDMDDDADDGDILNDVMFQRIWANESRNLSHKYSFSYQREVGSSFDPAMDDPSQLEESFQEGDEEIYDEDAELEAYIQEYMSSADDIDPDPSTHTGPNHDLEMYVDPADLSSEISEVDLSSDMEDDSVELAATFEPPHWKLPGRPANTLSTPQRMQFLANVLPSS